MKRTKEILHRLYHRGRAAVLRPAALRPYDLRRTMVVAGAPRSGTTWLAELLSAIPRSAILFEPLHLGNVPEARRHGFAWHMYVPPDADWPEGEAFLRRALEGKVLNPWTLSRVRFWDVVRVKTWIVKFVAANRLLPWLVKTFPVRAPVFLIRHPCAVVASQLRTGWWDNEKPPDDPRLFAAHPRFRDIVDGLEAHEELLAAHWCISNLVPLSVPKPYPWTLVAYEKLLLEPPREIQGIFDAWDAAVPDTLFARLERPSSTTPKTAILRSPHEHLTRWQIELSPEQTRRVLDVVRAFGINFYTEDPEPDYEGLSAFEESTSTSTAACRGNV